MPFSLGWKTIDKFHIKKLNKVAALGGKRPVEGFEFEPISLLKKCETGWDGRGSRDHF